MFPLRSILYHLAAVYTSFQIQNRSTLTNPRMTFAQSSHDCMRRTNEWDCVLGVGFLYLLIPPEQNCRHTKKQIVLRTCRGPLRPFPLPPTRSSQDLIRCDSRRKPFSVIFITGPGVPLFVPNSWTRSWFALLLFIFKGGRRSNGKCPARISWFPQFVCSRKRIGHTSNYGLCRC